MNDTKEFFHILWLYIKSKYKGVLLFIFSGAIVSFILLGLYSVPFQGIIYSFTVCLYVLVIFGIIDFYYFHKKIKVLQGMLKNEFIELENLPSPSHQIEKEYQNIINMILQENKNIITKNQLNGEKTKDYYTLWTHEIKTPISAMKLYINSKSDLDRNLLLTELFKIEQSVGSVLWYTRLESESTDYIIKQYSLDEIIKATIRKYAKVFIQKNISINYSGTNIKILTDEKWLSFVLEQILSNSVKYTSPNGKVSIYIADDTDANQIFLIIKDNGIGISSEDIPRVFDKSYTGHNGRKYKKSTGLGLYLSKKILTSLSHSIKIESKVNEGTKVIIGFNKKHIKHLN